MSSPLSPHLLRAEGICKTYKTRTVVDQVSLTVGHGEIVGLLGPNGAGKTTTMRILATLLKPTEGTAALDGVDVAGHPREIRRLMGYMPDFFGVYDRLKAWEYLDFYARCYGFGQKERRRMTDSLLELVNLTDKRDSYVDVLSGGMKQRLCLARALIHDPRLLILDEPAAGMNPQETVELTEFIREIREQFDLSILLIEHHMNLVMGISDRIYVLEFGKLIAEGIPEAVQMDQRVIDAYLGVDLDA